MVISTPRADYEFAAAASHRIDRGPDAFELGPQLLRPRRLRGIETRDERRDDGQRARAFLGKTHPDRSAPPLVRPRAMRSRSIQDRAMSASAALCKAEFRQRDDTDAEPQKLSLLAKLAVAFILALIVAGVVWHGVSIEIFKRIWRDLVARTDEPMRFRFILQPSMAMIAAMLGGLKDARTARSPYFWEPGMEHFVEASGYAKEAAGG
jgi:hypothetical protein